ncbi:MAG: hypothetical protein E6J91_45985 [Deltaproteobacteria bacterium]|nr:MAG: hypothetical protein E6J91_45985 [Deltaproteobacteria bacterium]
MGERSAEGCPWRCARGGDCLGSRGGEQRGGIAGLGGGGARCAAGAALECGRELDGEIGAEIAGEVVDEQRALECGAAAHGQARVVPAGAADQLHDLRDVAAVLAGEPVEIGRLAGAQLDVVVRQERGDDRGAVVAIGEVEQREGYVG